MARKTEPDEPETSAVPAAAPKRGKLAAVAVVLFLAGGGVGYGSSVVMSKEPTEPAEESAAEGGHEAAQGHGEAPAEGAAVADGSIFSLGEISVNLRGSGGGRLLRIEVQIEGSAAALASSEARLPQLRDALITVASDYTWNELEGSSGKMRLHDEFLVRINGILRPERAERVYFTKFIVQ